MKVGVLTGGGDCPGLNAVIRGLVRRGIEDHGYEFIGIKNGWLGLIENTYVPLDIPAISGILHRGGTILGTSRTNPLKSEDKLKKLLENVKKNKFNVIVAIGGDDTLTVAHKLHSKYKVNTIGIPKTIDNDICGTDFTFGFNTAINIAMEAIDRLHTTAESHHRVMILEVMGRHTGWIALYSGMAGGADAILVPEIDFDIDDVIEFIDSRKKRGRTFSIIVVAEGTKIKGKEITQSDKVDEFGHVYLGGIGEYLKQEIEKKVKIDCRVTVLGHVQRGGSPTAFDRVLGTRFGVNACDLINEKKYGYMVALRGTDIYTVPLVDAIKKTKYIDLDLYNTAKVFFG